MLEGDREMIGYGLAFVIGWLFFALVRAHKGVQVYPWSLGGWVWGLTFMGLNWLAGL